MVGDRPASVAAARLSIEPVIQAENLLLRRQLALYIEHGVKPRRIDAATRIALTMLSRLFDWRDALAGAGPATLIRWHRAGWRLSWRMRSRPGRPPIPPELQALIRRIANENPSWGEERIANELLLKLGIRLSPRTVPTSRHRHGESYVVRADPILGGLHHEYALATA
jgi:putative transposase